MSYETSEVPADDAVPHARVRLLKTVFHVVGNKLLTAGHVQGVLGILDGEVYHFLLHVVELDNGLSETHTVYFNLKL